MSDRLDCTGKVIILYLVLVELDNVMLNLVETGGSRLTLEHDRINSLRLVGTRVVDNCDAAIEGK